MIVSVKKIRNLISKNEFRFYFALLLAMAILTHLTWFDPFSIVTEGDWWYSHDEAIKELFKSLGGWIAGDNFGNVNIQIPFGFFMSVWSLVVSIGFSFSMGVKLTFLIPIAFMLFLSPFILLNKLTKNPLASFIGALYYGTTTYGIINQLPIQFIYSIAPFILYLFNDCLEKNKLKSWIIFILFYSIGIYYEVRIMFIVSFLLFFYYSFFFLEKRIILLKNLAITIFIAIGANSFWIIPTIFGKGYGEIAKMANRGLFGNSLFDIIHSFALSGWDWTGGFQNKNFIVQPVIWYFWIVPVLLIGSLIFFKKLKRSEKKYLLFFWIISLVGIFLTKQSSEPFIGVYLWLYKYFPGFNLFREASKFYLITAIGYMGLVAFSVLIIKRLVAKIESYGYIFFLLITILTISFSWNLKPVITGEIRSFFVSRNLPDDFKIEKDYILDQRENYFRTLWIPRASRWSIALNNRPRVSSVNMVQNNWKIFLNTSNTGYSLPVQNQIIEIYKKDFSNFLFDLSSIKYVAVPLQDKTNDDDFFMDYGGINNSNIRQWYIDQLDKISWLKKVDIGTEELVIYENENYKPPIFTFKNLLNFESFLNLEKKYDFISEELKKDFYFTAGNKESVDPSSQESIKNIFENLKVVQFASSGIKDRVNGVNLENGNFLYSSLKNGKNSAMLSKGKVIFYRDPSQENLLLNGKSLLDENQEKVEIKRIGVPRAGQYYLNLGGNLVKLEEGKEISLGDAVKEGDFSLLVEEENSFPNPSFENGLWQEKVGDCNNFDENGKLGMALDFKERSSGWRSLRLEATNHIACVSTSFSVQEKVDYMLSFDYQSPNSKTASFYLGFNDPAKTVIKDSANVSGNGWQKYSRKINVPEGANEVSLSVYSKSTDGVENIINRYDNFKFSKLTEIEKINLFEGSKFEKIAVDLKENGNEFEYQNSDFDYKNIIDNFSFENGLWEKKVGDCHNYDDKADLAMMANREEKTEGEQSLQLEARRHIACTSSAFPVKGGGSYFLSFDYQSPNSEIASYYIGYNDSNKTAFSESLPITGTSWQNFAKNLTIPEGATEMTLYVYAKESDGEKNIINRYDNFQLIETPDLSNAYYFVSEPKNNIQEPKSITFDLVNPTKKLVHVESATAPFFLAMSESFHPQWQLQMNNEKIQGLFGKWWPFVKPDRVSDDKHYKLDDFLNAWYVEPEVLCQNNSACTKNDDGSYNIEMVIEFWPQRWFYFGLIISVTTLLGCIGYLVYEFIKKRTLKGEIEKMRSRISALKRFLVGSWLFVRGIKKKDVVMSFRSIVGQIKEILREAKNISRIFFQKSIPRIKKFSIDFVEKAQETTKKAKPWIGKTIEKIKLRAEKTIEKVKNKLKK